MRTPWRLDRLVICRYSLSFNELRRFGEFRSLICRRKFFGNLKLFVFSRGHFRCPTGVNRLLGNRAGGLQEM
jgi:hypothetical protein